MKRIAIVIGVVLTTSLAYYPYSVANYERRRLNRFGVMLRSHTNPLPPGATLNLDRYELDGMLREAKRIADHSRFAQNRKRAKKLVEMYYHKFPPVLRSVRAA